MPPKALTASKGSAAEPSSEIDELADDPALQPRPPSDPARLAKVPRRKKSVKSAGAAADGTENDKKPPRGESHKQQRRAKSASRDAEGGDSEAAATAAAGAARLARFRYAGPSAGSHQRIDPTTLEDSMASSSDPVDTSPARNPTNRPPKRPLAQEQTLVSPPPPPPQKKKKRTLSATNGTSGPLTPSRPTKTVEEPVFVMPEFDEDGNLIEDENENSLAPASSSSRTPVRPFDAPVKSAPAPRSPTEASSAEAFAVAVGSSPAPNRLPSSIELPNSLAQRIYGGSQTPDRKQVLPGAVSARDAQHDLAMVSDAGNAQQECSSPPAAKPKAPAPPTPHPLPATPRKSSTAQPSPFRPAKNQPKVLSSADLLAVAEVLAGLDSQALDDLDGLDDDFELTRKGNAQPSAVEKATSAPETANNAVCAMIVPTEPATMLTSQALVTKPPIAPSNLGKAPATSRVETRVEAAAKQTDSAPIETAALPGTSSSTFRLDPKPLRLPPSPPQKRPASYRLVSNNLEGALAHLRTVVAEATEQADSGKRHEVEYLRGEVSRLATELESRDAAIGELADEVRELRARLEGAERREDAWEGEREGWARERQEWEMRVDVLKEIRRGLLDDLTELQAALSSDAAAVSSDRSTPTREIAHAGHDDQPGALDGATAGDCIADAPDVLHGGLPTIEQPSTAPGCEA